MNTKTVLTLVILSAGMLTGLTSTMIQATPVYADTEDCKDNDDDNCNTTNDRTLRIEQENNCRAENGGTANGGSGDGGGTGGLGGNTGDNDNRFECTNEVFEPNTGNNAFNGPTS